MEKGFCQTAAFKNLLSVCLTPVLEQYNLRASVFLCLYTDSGDGLEIALALEVVHLGSPELGGIELSGLDPWGSTGK